MIGSTYLSSIYDVNKYKPLIDNIIVTINKLKESIGFDAIVFSGNSGSGVAYTISYLTGIPVICVRKKKESTASNFKVEGLYVPKSYIIIDDFFVSGRTIKHIVSNMKKESPKSELVGVIVYEGGNFLYTLDYQVLDRTICVQDKRIPLRLSHKGE
jgi:adenine/guanine phosphoribosyltransferase-like PRPP-binding protein